MASGRMCGGQSARDPSSWMQAHRENRTRIRLAPPAHGRSLTYGRLLKTACALRLPSCLSLSLSPRIAFDPISPDHINPTHQPDRPRSTAPIRPDPDHMIPGPPIFGPLDLQARQSPGNRMHPTRKWFFANRSASNCRTTARPQHIHSSPGPGLRRPRTYADPQTYRPHAHGFTPCIWTRCRTVPGQCGSGLVRNFPAWIFRPESPNAPVTHAPDP